MTQHTHIYAGTVQIVRRGEAAQFACNATQQLDALALAGVGSIARDGFGAVEAAAQPVGAAGGNGFEQPSGAPAGIAGPDFEWHHHSYRPQRSDFPATPAAPPFRSFL